MNSANREKLILLLFPSALVALVWWGWFRPTNRLSSNEKSAATAHAAAPQPDAILHEKVKQTALAREVTQLKQEKENYLQRWAHLRAELGRKENRPQALERLGDVFRENSLTIIHEQPLNGQTSPSAKSLDELHRRLNQPVETTFVELKSASSAKSTMEASPPSKAAERAVWEIDFAGGYDEVQAALHQLIAEDGDLMPLVLRMAPADPSLKLRRWTLVISL